MPQMNTVLIGGARTAIMALMPSKIPPNFSPNIDQTVAATITATAVACPIRTSDASEVCGRSRLTISMLAKSSERVDLRNFSRAGVA